MQAGVVLARAPRHALLRLSGEIDLSTAGRLVDVAAGIICSSPESSSLCLDLGRVTFMDCQGVAFLLAVRALANAADVRLSLAAVPARVARVLTTTGVDSFFRYEARRAQP